MAEPSTSTAIGITLVSGAALSTILPHIDSNAVFGAIMGAALVASTRTDLPGWKRLMSFLFSALCGYGGAGEFLARDLAKQSFFPAMLTALVIIPLALKVMALGPDIDLSRLRTALSALFGGSKE